MPSFVPTGYVLAGTQLLQSASSGLVVVDNNVTFVAQAGNRVVDLHTDGTLTSRVLGSIPAVPWSPLAGGVSHEVQSWGGGGNPVPVFVSNGRLQQTTDGLAVSTIDLGGNVTALAEGRDTAGKQVLYVLRQDGTLYKDTATGVSALATGVATLIQSWDGSGKPVPLFLAGGRFQQTTDGVNISTIDLGGTITQLARSGSTPLGQTIYALRADGILFADTSRGLTVVATNVATFAIDVKSFALDAAGMYLLKTDGSLWYSGTGQPNTFQQCSLGGLSATQGTVNQSYSGSISFNVAGNGITRLAVTGLPNGVTAQLSGNTIALAGTLPRGSGQYNVGVSLTLNGPSWAVVQQSYTLTVNPGSVASLLMTSSTTTATVGSRINVTITARDAYGNVATGDNGTVTLSSSNTNSLPSTSLSLSHGVGTVSLAPTHSGSATLTPSQGAIKAGGLAYTINPSLYLYTYNLVAYDDGDYVTEEDDLNCYAQNDSQAFGFMSNAAAVWGQTLHNEGIDWNEIDHAHLRKVAAN
jgi:hypothetical protein